MVRTIDVQTTRKAPGGRVLALGVSLVLLLGQGGFLAAAPSLSWIKRLPKWSPFPTSPLPLESVETRFIQVFPEPPKDQKDPAPKRSPGQLRAVVLIHGLQLHPFQVVKIENLLFRPWQKPGSVLVKALSKYADVFAYAYTQHSSLEAIASAPDLKENVLELRELGYQEIILVGHSAGGLIARHLVEDHPDLGVTRVLQVCTPNLGCNFAKLDPGMSKGEKEFVHSLTRDSRIAVLKARGGKRIPAAVQFLCVVGDLVGPGDGVVSVRSQWPGDLQSQGIPMVLLKTNHFSVMRSSSSAEKIAELVTQSHTRWNGKQVAAGKKVIGE